METTHGTVCRQHLDFMKWADDKVLAAVSQLSHDKVVCDLGNSFKSLFDTLSHIYLAELVWFRRVTGEPKAMLADHTLPASLETLAAAWPDLHEEWIEWSRSCSNDKWARSPEASDKPGKLTYWQIVMHLVNHGSLSSRTSCDAVAAIRHYTARHGPCDLLSRRWSIVAIKAVEQWCRFKKRHAGKFVCRAPVIGALSGSKLAQESGTCARICS